MIISSKQSLISISKKEKLSCIVVSLPEDIKAKITKWAKKHIKEEDLFYIDDKRGRENHLHITLKYGLYTNDADKVKEFLKQQEAVDIRLGPISKFRDVSDEFDILKIEAYGSDLQKFNKSIEKEFDSKKQRNKYLPHITLAYVNKDACEDLIGSHEYEDEEVTGKRFVFLDDDSEPTTIQVKASRIDYPKEDLPAEIWDKKGSSYILKPEVAKYLLERIRRALEKEFKASDQWIDTYLIGSSIATVFWTIKTDIDIKVVINERSFKASNPQFKSLNGDKLIEAILEVFDKYKDTDFFKYHKHPIEIYPAMTSEIKTNEFLKRFDSLYDVNSQKWIKEPHLVNTEDYNRDEVVEEGLEMALKFAAEWTLDIGEIKIKLKELELLVKHLKSLPAKSRERFKEKLQVLCDSITEDIKEIHEEKDEVKEEYHEAYMDYSEDLKSTYESVNALPEVIRIKLLNLWGFITIIKQLNKVIENKDGVDISDIPKIDKALKSSHLISFRHWL